MKNFEAKVIIEESVKKLEDSIKRENNYLKELSDDRIALKAVLVDQESGEPLDDDQGYVTYNEWVEQLGKEIRAGENSLERIGNEKAEIIAFNYFLEKATDEEVA